MNMMWKRGIAVALLAVTLTGEATAQQVAAPPLASYTDGMLVTSNDVSTCPYTLVGAVSVNMRAHSYKLKELESESIAKKLRTKAKEMNADAVVLVTVGQSHMTLTSIRSTPVTGRAIRYVDRSCAPKG
jgi:uncharacterized protein YbjQ (UPF0145 family)